MGIRGLFLLSAVLMLLNAIWVSRAIVGHLSNDHADHAAEQSAITTNRLLPKQAPAAWGLSTARTVRLLCSCRMIDMLDRSMIPIFPHSGIGQACVEIKQIQAGDALNAEQGSYFILMV